MRAISSYATETINKLRSGVEISQDKKARLLQRLPENVRGEVHSQFCASINPKTGTNYTATEADLELLKVCERFPNSLEIKGGRASTYRQEGEAQLKSGEIITDQNERKYYKFKQSYDEELDINHWVAPRLFSILAHNSFKTKLHEGKICFEDLKQKGMTQVNRFEDLKKVIEQDCSIFERDMLRYIIRDNDNHYMNLMKSDHGFYDIDITFCSAADDIGKQRTGLLRDYGKLDVVFVDSDFAAQRYYIISRRSDLSEKNVLDTLSNIQDGERSKIISALQNAFPNDVFNNGNDINSWIKDLIAKDTAYIHQYAKEQSRIFSFLKKISDANPNLEQSNDFFKFVMKHQQQLEGVKAKFAAGRQASISVLSRFCMLSDDQIDFIFQGYDDPDNIKEELKKRRDYFFKQMKQFSIDESAAANQSESVTVTKQFSEIEGEYDELAKDLLDLDKRCFIKKISNGINKCVEEYKDFHECEAKTMWLSGKGTSSHEMISLFPKKIVEKAFKGKTYQIEAIVEILNNALDGLNQSHPLSGKKINVSKFIEAFSWGDKKRNIIAETFSEQEQALMTQPEIQEINDVNLNRERYVALKKAVSQRSAKPAEYQVGTSEALGVVRLGEENVEDDDTSDSRPQIQNSVQQGATKSSWEVSRRVAPPSQNPVIKWFSEAWGFITSCFRRKTSRVSPE